MTHKIYWAKRNNGKSIIAIRNLLNNKTWLSYYFRGKGESLHNKYWIKRLKNNNE